MTFTNLIRFLKIVYSGIAPQVFYYVGFFCLWLLSFVMVVYGRHLGMFVFQATSIIPDEFGFTGIDPDIYLVSGEYFSNSFVNPASRFTESFQPHLRFYIWNLYCDPYSLEFEGNNLLSLPTYETEFEKEHIKKVKRGLNQMSHAQFFLSTEFFGKVKLSNHYKWAYYGAEGGQYSYYDEFEEMIVDPRLGDRLSRYSTEYMRYNLSFFFSDPLMLRENNLDESEYDENYVSNTLAFSGVGFFFLNAIRNDFWIISADYFLFRHSDDNLTQQDEEDINTAYHLFMNVPRCLDFVKNEGVFYRFFEYLNDDFFRAAGEEEIFFLMEHFGESDFIYDDVYIDSIEDDELGGSWDFVSNVESDMNEGQDYDDTIWELRWDPTIDYVISNVVKSTFIYKYTRIAHIDHMKNYPWWYGITTKETTKKYHDFRIGCDFFLKKKVVERDAKIKAELVKLDGFKKAIDDVFFEIAEIEIKQIQLIQQIAINLGYDKQQILRIAADGPSFKYKENFEERKQIFTTYDQTILDPLEKELDKLTLEEMPSLYEKVTLIKEQERLYKNELDEARLKKEKGLTDEKKKKKRFN